MSNVAPDQGIVDVHEAGPSNGIEALTLRDLRAFFHAADQDNHKCHEQQPATRQTVMSSPVASTTAAAWSRAFAVHEGRSL